MRTGILIVILLLTACGEGLKTYEDRLEFDSTHGEFTHYIQKYETTYNVHVAVYVNFKEISEDKAGICRKWRGGYNEIYINEAYWDTYSYEQKLNLIFHELGHCVHNLGHEDARLEDNCPTSFMDHNILTENCASKHYDYYIGELRERINRIK